VELNLARKFVKESKLHLDPVHYTRALAMLAEAHGNRGDCIAALEYFDQMAEVYSLDDHSQAISDVYGTDHAAQLYAYRAVWHEQIKNLEKSLSACEHVIQDILPLIDSTNTLCKYRLLYIVCRVLKRRGQEERLLRLFDEYVISPCYHHFGPSCASPCTPMFKPITYLLGICHDPSNFESLDEAAAWLCSDPMNGVLSDFFDNVSIRMCWSVNDLVAELCLRIANRLALEPFNNTNRQRLLVAKGLMLVEAAERKLRNKDGSVVFPLAIEMHEPVYDALQTLGKEMGVEPMEDHCTPVRPLNVKLPPSYLKNI